MKFVDQSVKHLRRVELAGWMGIAVAVGACGGARPEASAPTAESATATAADGDGEATGESEGSADVAAFEKASEELRAAFPSLDAGGQPAPTPMHDDDDDGEEISALQTRDRCQVACAALSSMKRSADRVCEMTGGEDSRCEQLRERVERARSTVYANCPSCAAARP